ncbi:unnamed protein product [Coffea canephora]|uniref:Uncharacterized protein n=1 Tax=Coffea canephora TaxID=49390 RepID=A0A068V688_COFCA|nr:unnamed protein product [Coffea canephora]
MKTRRQKTSSCYHLVCFPKLKLLPNFFKFFLNKICFFFLEIFCLFVIFLSRFRHPILFSPGKEKQAVHISPLS